MCLCAFFFTSQGCAESGSCSCWSWFYQSLSVCCSCYVFGLLWRKKGHRRCTPKSVSCKPLTPWFAKVKRNMLVLKKLNYALKETNLAFLVSGPLSQIPIWGSPFQAPISSHHLRSPTSDPPPQTSYLRPHASPLSRNPGLPSQVTYAWRLILCPSLETLSQRHNNR